VTTLSYEDREEDWGEIGDEADGQVPRRPRRQFFNRRVAALLAAVACAAGFYAGVQIEKGQVRTSSASATLPALSAGGGSGARTATRGVTGSAGAGGLPGGGPGGANGSVGTISSVSGRALYLKDSSGNTVKVKLSSATKLTKSLSVSRKSVRPGDSVVIQGVKNSQGVLVASSVSDSGASSTSSSSTSGSSTSGSSSGSSSVGSLFSGGSSGAGG
jgi:hypothetical protein